MLLQGHQHPVGLFIVTNRTNGQAAQAQLGGIDHGSARRSGHRKADFLDEVHIAPVRNAGDRAAQYIKDVQADDGNIVAHVSRLSC